MTLLADNLPLLQLFFLAFAAGLFIRITLTLAGQQWAKTYSNTVTYLLLPAVGLVIVLVISDSIALSLGMIGALSIVRFRHPVKSPLELVVYFLLLTVGVALSTRPFLALLLVIASALVIVAVSFYQRLKARNGEVPFPLNPADGDRVFILEISASDRLSELDTCPDLVFAHEDRRQGIYNYKLAFPDRQTLDVWRTRINELESVEQVSGTYQ